MQMRFLYSVYFFLIFKWDMLMLIAGRRRMRFTCTKHAIKRLTQMKKYHWSFNSQVFYYLKSDNYENWLLPL